LTNYSVNKNAPKFVKNKDSSNDGEGSKWSLTALRKYLREQNHNVDELFKGI
jgi:tubulin polyglutamylase TTLL6/13